MQKESQQSMDLEALKARLSQSQGRQYWRTLSELAETPGFLETLANEVPQATRTLNLHVDRRQFLTLTGASLALAGLSGCRFLPQQKLVPYVRQPEELTLGIPLYYATAVPTLTGFGVGVIVTSREGRPIKIEGNPDHPDSLGATDALIQASILSLYDPDRSQVVMHQGDFSSWQEFYDTAHPALDKIRSTGGASLRILTETVTSPTLAAQLQQVQAQYPQAQWIQYEPTGRNSAHTGTIAAFGQPANAIYQLDVAKRILSLDADFLLNLPGHIRYAHQFANGRRIRSGTTDMNRLYVIESMPSITGAMADHRLPVRASQVEGLARVIATRLGVDVGSAPALALDADTEKLIAGLVKDLQSNPGTSVVIPGEFQPPAVHTLAHAINEKIGAFGKTVVLTEPVVAAQQDQIASLKSLVEDMKAGKVDMLLILSGNPIYNVPIDLDFATALNRVPFRIHLSHYEDETSLACHWHLPESHFMEAWGDIRAYDGTTSIIQPLIQPLFDSRSAGELLSGLFDTPNPKTAPGKEPRDGYTIVRQYWEGQGYPIKQFDVDFNRLLHDGLIPNTVAKTLPLAVKPGAAAALTPSPVITAGGDTLELIIRPDPTIWDGRHANNGWLQELPKPISRTVWDNVAFMSPETAGKHQIPLTEPSLDHAGGSPVIEITLGDQKVTAPVWILPGHPDDAITLTLGYGRSNAGELGSDIGVNTYKLFRSDNTWHTAVKIVMTGDSYNVATTQYHHLMEGRDLVRVGTITQFIKSPSLAPDEDELEGSTKGTQSDMGEGKNQANMYPAEQHRWPQDPKDSWGAYNWGMSVDIQSCIGCNACMVACQSENNIPVVGKEQAMRGRHMSWIRIDTYYRTDPDKPNSYFHNPETYFQPVMCMQCEQAPCEPVCPVAATVHSEEGLNQMVYNRCIGTRYCSNNCPYKVRRYNFLNYNNHFDIGVKQLVFNPEVTVRSRGVMEKCSYCVQRINTARQKAKIEGRQLGDGEVVTACQQVCPTQAIIFGNITDSATKVAALKTQPHNYGLLTELNTRPRTTYLGRVTNPNTEIVPETEQKGG